jgi:hypothetical protein
MIGVKRKSPGWGKVLLASVVVPPVGLVMWWMRPWTGGWISRTVGFIGRVAVSGALVILTLFYLIQLNVLHMELSGAGWQPIFSLRDPRKDQEALEIWENKNLKNRFNSSVLHRGFIYGFDEGIFACIDARTGERKWKGGRYGYGQVLLAGDHMIVLAEDGDLVLLKASPDAHQELARFSAIKGKTWNHPAIEGNILLVRNAREMAAFNLAP